MIKLIAVIPSTTTVPPIPDNNHTYPIDDIATIICNHGPLIGG